MITHEKCPGVSDVEKFLNRSGLRLDQVKIVYGSAGRFSGSYYVFYDTLDYKEPAQLKLPKKSPVPKPPVPAKEPEKEPEGELILTPVDRDATEAPT